MSLSAKQREELTKAAKAEGVDPAAVLAAAEAQLAAPTGEEPKLFQYHLPFIRVRELRQVWLGLEERIDDDDLACGKWLEKHGGVLIVAAGGSPPGGAPE